ncbi:hypothetical protein J2Z19_001667 [Ensifer adhaerens]|uniref:Uncharacterized protein n=1 Tax=Ensifer adhaerens TaxID=106592 RepID=A0ACC5ST43_ENSAD|nr:site-specific integrase [Ensifer adhaerens]MBP1871955.1 hypothetical protein [Ensifer adhaerens]
MEKTVLLRTSPRDRLPEEAITRDGFRYSPLLDHWCIVTETGRKHFHFNDLRVSPDLTASFKQFISTLLLAESPNTVHWMYQQVRSLLVYVGSYDSTSTEILPSHLLNFGGSLAQEHRYRSGDANCAVRLWSKLTIPGISHAAFVTAAEMPRKSRKRAQAVRLRDPYMGAYTNIEYDGLYKALHAKFATGTLSLCNYAICLLSGAIAPRPVQLASLMVGDFKAREVNGAVEYVLSVPRAKQRGGRHRSQFTDRPLVEDIGIVIEAQARLVRKQAKDAGLKHPDQVPLFPANHVKSTFYIGGGIPVAPTSGSIATRIINVMESLQVKSERTGEAINAHATRARRTLGTRAAQAGCSLEEIAVLLDHTSLRAAHHYIEIRSELLQNIDRKVAILLAPLAQRFAGSIQNRINDQEVRVQRHVFGVGDSGAPVDVGGCGKFGFCGLGRPIACYTCRLFYPWQDGPHGAILESLLARREKMAAEGSLIVAQSLDDTILACAEVVRQCQLMASGAAE